MRIKFCPSLVFLSLTVLALPGIASAQECPGFPDVPKDHWAASAVIRLKCMDIVRGYPEGKPSQTRTRKPNAALPLMSSAPKSIIQGKRIAAHPAPVRSTNFADRLR